MIDRASYIRVALAYIGGLNLLYAAEKAGTLADPDAITNELDRAARTLRAVLKDMDDVP